MSTLEIQSSVVQLGARPRCLPTIMLLAVSADLSGNRLIAYEQSHRLGSPDELKHLIVRLSQVES